MNPLALLDDWVASTRTLLADFGTVVYAKSDSSRPKPSAQLLVSRSSGDVELILWQSGEAEFAYGSSAAPRFEHFDITSAEDLHVVLERFLAVLETSTPP